MDAKRYELLARERIICRSFKKDGRDSLLINDNMAGLQNTT
jgi:hypothetical protein